MSIYYPLVSISFIYIHLLFFNVFHIYFHSWILILWTLRIYFTCYILICCAMWSVQCATYCYAACLVSLCNNQTIHSIAQPLSTQTENVKKHLSWFFLLKFHIQTSHFFNFGGLRLPSWWWNLRLLRRFWWGRHLRYLTITNDEMMQSGDCLCAILCWCVCECEWWAFDSAHFTSFHSTHQDLDQVDQVTAAKCSNTCKEEGKTGRNMVTQCDTMWHNVTHVEQNLAKTCYWDLLRVCFHLFWWPPFQPVEGERSRAERDAKLKDLRMDLIQDLSSRHFCLDLFGFSLAFHWLFMG